MKKVCHITSAHDQEDIRIFHKECISLAKAGYDVCLVQPGGCYEKNGVYLVGWGLPAKGRLERFLYSARAAYQTALKLDADIYHLHDPELLRYGLKLKRRGKKVIFDSHEFHVEQMRLKSYIPSAFRGIATKVYELYQNFILSKLDGLVFPCLLRGENPFEDKCCRVAMVDNFPKLEELYDRFDPAAEKYDNSICQIGSLTPSRGITHLVKAAALADCMLYLGGSFSSVEYEAQIRAMPEADHVVFLGELNRQEVVETLQHCQVGAATLLNIGQYDASWNLSTKVYEQMSMGLPTVLNRCYFHEILMEKYRFGICVDPENEEEIAAALRYLLDHPEEAKRMGEAGRRAVKEEFNWGIEEKKLLALYEDIFKE